MKLIDRSDYPTLLLQAASASSMLRVTKVIYQEVNPGCLFQSKWIPITEEQRWSRNHPYLEACDAAKGRCKTLARFCRAHDIDLRASPLYGGLEFKELMEDILEKDRVVKCDTLTPAVIFYAAKKRNVLHWDGWEIATGKGDFFTDTYGLDQWVYPLIASKEGHAGFTLSMPGEEVARARNAYREITGKRFAGDDGLGEDRLHSYEIYCGH